jgi:hypothetical protein
MNNNDLRTCYELITKKFSNCQLDSFQTIQCVEDYRNYWKPKKVSVVLLAESHVMTTDRDSQVTLNNTLNQKSELPDYPQRYVRFVYCLGYGENELLQNPEDLESKNTGTWQYWKLLYSCNELVDSNKDFARILKKSTPKLKERIQNKIQLLRNLREKGIWLVDASIVGVNNLSKKDRMEIIKMTWDNYLHHMLFSLESDFHILTIGKTVNAALQESDKSIDYEERRGGLISQPQARLSKQDRLKEYQQSYTICHRFAQKHEIQLN